MKAGTRSGVAGLSMRTECVQQYLIAVKCKVDGVSLGLQLLDHLETILNPVDGPAQTGA
jgi:hypothetical protein